MSAAPFDYAPIKLIADTLIPQFGIPIVLARASRAAQKDWEQDQGPAATTAAQSISGLSGVQIALDEETLALQTIERPLGRWVFQASTSLLEVVGPEWTLTANSLTYQVVTTRPVQPGDTLLVYFAVVEL